MSEFQQANRVLPGPTRQALLLQIIIHRGSNRNDESKGAAQANYPESSPWEG